MKTQNASADVQTAATKASHRRAFLPSFNTHLLGLLPKHCAQLVMSALARRSLKDKHTWRCVSSRDHVFNQNSPVPEHVSKSDKQRYDDHVRVFDKKVSRRCLCFSSLTHTSWMFLQKMYTQKLCLRRQGVFRINTTDITCLFCSRDGAFHLKILGKLAMFQNPPTMYIMSTLEEAGTKVLPRCLCFSPSTHILWGVLPKNLDLSMLCLRRRGVSKKRPGRFMSSSEKSPLLHKTLSKYRMIKNIHVKIMGLVLFAADLSKNHRCTLKTQSIKDMAREDVVLATYRNDRNCFL